ncbi:MAG TPA: hypothetical protein VGN97_05035 [Mesorhizobium sp.]|jgi:hypothetical protein|nr:hypothetical protein [Mesorhizobium sp.]
MSIPAKGFCIYLQRKREEKRTTRKYGRTVGEYRCYWDGQTIAGLSGQLVERQGPGDNTDAVGNAKDLRIAAGTYPLAVHDGAKYQTLNYASSGSPSAKPKPGLLVKGTGERDYILVHPGMDYVWAVGCLNPASGLADANSKISYSDSRQQVIALIDAMKARLGGQFPKKAGATIPGAVIVITGEP